MKIPILVLLGTDIVALETLISLTLAPAPVSWLMLCAGETLDKVVFAGEPEVTKTVALYGNVFCKIDETVEQLANVAVATTADKNKFFIIVNFDLNLSFRNYTNFIN